MTGRVQLVELDPHDRGVLVRRHPELRGCGTALVVAASADARQQLVPALGQLVDVVNAAEQVQIERLVDDLIGGTDLPDERQREQARREARLRGRILRDFGWHRGPELADLAGSSATNRWTTASRWKRQRRVFSVTVDGHEVFPSFQLDERGRPRPVVAVVLHELAAWAPWDVARWFVVANARLERQRPVDLLVGDPEAVIDAAARDGRQLPPAYV